MTVARAPAEPLTPQHAAVFVCLLQRRLPSRSRDYEHYLCGKLMPSRARDSFFVTVRSSAWAPRLCGTFTLALSPHAVTRVCILHSACSTSKSQRCETTQGATQPRAHCGLGSGVRLLMLRTRCVAVPWAVTGYRRATRHCAAHATCECVFTHLLACCVDPWKQGTHHAHSLAAHLQRVAQQHQLTRRWFDKIIDARVRLLPCELSTGPPHLRV